MKSNKKPRVAVGMSGGVDSSVAAALLKQAGYDVIGLFARTWTPQSGDGTTCTWVADRRDALRVAAQLEIPLKTVDLETEYRAGVVEPLFSGYSAGETPNPDVLCNRVVKFDALYKVAQELGADYFATGHYARIEHSGKDKIFRGVDSNKDQTYFLWDILPNVLPHILFPIGDYPKEKVREIAYELGLSTATKKDSQGICFLGQTNLPAFLQTRLSSRSGEIRDARTNEIVGEHMGIFQLTIGQRHNIGQINKTYPEGVFVVKIDADTNTAWVGPREMLYHDYVEAKDCNWLNSDFLDKIQAGNEARVSAQVRYRQKAQMATVRLENEHLVIKFDEKIYAPTVGQSIVLYDGDQMLGGAIIAKVV